MKTMLGLFAIVLLSTCSCLSTHVSPWESSEMKDFSVDTRAGQGGKILRVTNLDSEGPGSLRAALETKGPRTVLFEVGGVIDLGKKNLEIVEPFLTIAGQTAPSPGITIIRGAIYVRTHNILMQHLRVRPGDAGEPKQSGWSPDGISTFGGNAYNIVIDHCSISWAVDENLSTSGARTEGPDATSHRITFSNCIVAEALHESSHEKGTHSMGSLIHDFCTDIAIVGNLYAHNNARNPYFKAHTTGVIVNNVIYNPGIAAIQLGYSESEWRDTPLEPRNCRISVVGNILIHGENTKRGLPLVAKKGDVYLEDNIALDKNEEPVPITSDGVNKLEQKPVWPDGLVAIPSQEVIEYVVRHAGARPKDRDEIDKRIIREFQNREGCIIDSQNDVGGYPEVEMTTRKLKLPEGNIENWLSRLASELENW